VWVAVPGLVALATIAGIKFLPRLVPAIPGIISGLLVGIGVSYSSGCTSGHGVSGMSRLSVRGFAATCCFILAGGIGVVIFRHLLGVI
jgi:uncharacterized membrane protein YedE/YeeE